jgi:hypothetical protein
LSQKDNSFTQNALDGARVKRALAAGNFCERAYGEAHEAARGWPQQRRIFIDMEESPSINSEFISFHRETLLWCFDSGDGDFI